MKGMMCQCYINVLIMALIVQLTELLSVQYRRKTMQKKLAETINEKLGQIAAEIRVSSSSNIYWGEVELPKCLRMELETDTDK